MLTRNKELSRMFSLKLFFLNPWSDESGVRLESLAALNAIPNSLPLSRVWPSTHHVLTLRKR